MGMEFKEIKFEWKVREKIENLFSCCCARNEKINLFFLWVPFHWFVLLCLGGDEHQPPNQTQTNSIPFQNYTYFSTFIFLQLYHWLTYC